MYAVDPKGRFVTIPIRVVKKWKFFLKATRNLRECLFRNTWALGHFANCVQCLIQWLDKRWPPNSVRTRTYASGNAPIGE